MITLEIAKQWLLNLRRSAPLNVTILLVVSMISAMIFVKRKVSI